MDLLNVLFNKDKPFTPITISAGTTRGLTRGPSSTTFEQRLQRSEREILEDDVEICRQHMKKQLEVTLNTSENVAREEDYVYTKYKFDQISQNAYQLPIYGSRHEILTKLAKSPTMIIEGSTGCGKSTQVPQMILNNARSNRSLCNIVVTQPRRIAARSIAERVCRERGWELGSLVGYQIGLDKNFVSEDTRLLFCTTGVLLEKLIQTKTLANYTHIILDEVHERDKDMEFLLIIIRMLMAKEETNIKVILMSATFDTNMFAKYFEYCRNGRWEPAPIIKVDKQRLFQVQTHYLDSFEKLRQVPNIDLQNPSICDEMYKLALRLINSFKMDEKDATTRGSILIFLPGIYEIGKMRNVLMEYTESKVGLNWKIFILHSLISTEEQQLIFQPVDSGGRKIILSTNIAESSITVPDVTYVIDFCLMKYLKCDTSKNFTSLVMDWASRNNCMQRAGRAGRVANGRCYRLVNRQFFENYMKQAAIPELLLSPLENVILKAKTFDMGPPHVILGMAMKDSTPKLDDVANTILLLKELGALKLTYKDEGYTTMDGDLTFLGRVMSNLPLDIRASRLIAFGYCFSVLEECIIMAAGLTSKSIFKISFDRDLREYSRRLEWSNGSGSDLFAVLNAYRIWTSKYNQREFGKGKDQQKAERDFCYKHCLDVRSLHECHHLVQELTQRLEKLGIRSMDGVERVIWTEQEKTIILKVVIAGAFYPNYYATATIDNPMVERDVFHVMNGRDPENTVYFTGFRIENIRELYADNIRNLFRDKVVEKADLDCVKISFDDNSEKVFVTFDMNKNFNEDNRTDWETKHVTIPGKTLTEVYKAVKMRKIGMQTNIGIMKHDKERDWALDRGIGVMDGSKFMTKRCMRDSIRDLCIPNAITKEVTGTVTHIENCSKFWFQPITEREEVQRYFRELNEKKRNITQCVDYASVTNKHIIVARDSNDQKLYRARLVSWDLNQVTKEYKSATVCFIDFGHTQRCKLDDVFIFTRQTEMAVMPPRCFPARLAEIQPSTANITGGHIWENASVDLFRKFIKVRDTVKAEIYSVVNGTVNVFLSVNSIKLNDLLISKNYGETCDENFLSKNNHWKRQESQANYEENAVDEGAFEFNDCEEYYPITSVEPINLDEKNCDRFIKLRGPTSPLESQVYSVLFNNYENAITIDAHSVNSVFLTSMQQDFGVKYMVAAHVSQNGTTDKIFNIHETTLLPSIRGFGAFMSMIFCPSMDLKRDEWNSRYISMRTGLGYNNDNGSPYFPEHDTIYHLDFELKDDDISLVNRVRYIMDSLLFSFGDRIRNETLSDKNRYIIMKELKDVIINLLTKNRKVMELVSSKHEWKEYDDKDFEKANNIYGANSIFPLHGVLRLKPMNERARKQLKLHCAELRKMTISMPRPVICRLCSTQVENMMMMRTHLLTRLHLDREKSVGFTSTAKKL